MEFFEAWIKKFTYSILYIIFLWTVNPRKITLKTKNLDLVVFANSKTRFLFFQRDIILRLLS